MVQFADLSNDKNSRKIRNVVIHGGESIKVFEPTQDDLEVIIDLQEKFMDSQKKEGEEVSETKIKVSDVDMVRVLFPLLTDIEGLDTATDEEIDFVIENPTVAFLHVNHIIEGIITESWKMILLEASNRVLEADFHIETLRATNEINEKTLGLVGRENSGRVEKLRKANDKFDKALKEQEDKAMKELQEKVRAEQPVSSPVAKDKAVVALENYKKIFDQE